MVFWRSALLDVSSIICDVHDTRMAGSDAGLGALDGTVSSKLPIRSDL